MFPAPDRNFQVPWIMGKRFSCPSWIFDPNRSAALTRRGRFHGSLAFPGVTSFIRTPSLEKGAGEKKLTFKPAIKTKNVKSLILRASLSPLARPSRGSDSWSMRINHAAAILFLPISQAEHVRYLVAIPKSACSGMYIVSDYSKIPDFCTLNFKIHFGLCFFIRPEMDRKWTSKFTNICLIRM